MLHSSLINPQSIAVIGGSNNPSKPGGKIVTNLLEGSFSGDLFIVNPKENEVQGITCFKTVKELPNVDLAILAIPAKFCAQTVEVLTEQKNARGFIIISAGFGEGSEEGQQIENQISQQINKVGGSLIGPNCIGVINANYQGVFTLPVPKLSSKGVDLISGSGATAVFIMEAGMQNGLQFNQVFSVGNSAQTGVEDVLEHLDESYKEGESSKIKLLYIESFADPRKFLKHASSLINKGCKIAAIKAGYSNAGSRAASSHTGAVATSDFITRALFRKAGIVYCSSRTELITVAGIFDNKELIGKNIAVITHAGGSAVMLTDALEKGGLSVPPISGAEADELLTNLYPGSSVANPIDFLATGTADQLGIIIDYCEHNFDEIDGMAVVFGSAGLFDVENVYKVLNVKMKFCKKPIYPVLPSLVNAEKEIEYFLSKGRINFPDEVDLGSALAEVYCTPKPTSLSVSLPEIDNALIRKVIDSSSSGLLAPDETGQILAAAGIPTAYETVVSSKDEALQIAAEIGFPLVMKVVGPVHKTDVGGVVLNVTSNNQVENEFSRLMNIDEVTGVLMQSQLSGLEIFVGARKEGDFGHIIMCGLGGIYIEVFKDVRAGLSPVGVEEARTMISRLKIFPILEGYRGKEGVNIEMFAQIISKVSALVELAPEIEEMDLNPLMASGDQIYTVDARIILS
ncbi:MAG: acetate--CoA ligase family protein [Salibacteraceae bacterium]